LNASRGSIPARVVIGVTGHRQLDDDAVYTDKITEIVEKIARMIPPLNNTPLVYVVLSPLAEGADRIVAREILKQEDSRLEVVLPFEQGVYAQDFKTPASREEFREFLTRAKKVVTLSGVENREDGYLRAGRYVVDNCDILIALWDGKESAGTGGTAEVVKYARSSGCPLFWLNTSRKIQAIFEKGLGLNQQSYLQLEEFNSEKIKSARCELEIEKYRENLNSKADETNFSSDLLPWIYENFLPRFVRTDLLAEKYQKLYFTAGSWVYALAALAVAAVTFQILFLPHIQGIAWIEVLCMLGVIAIFGIGNRKRWHLKWIDYRFLAERLRSAIFLALTGMNITAMRPPRHLSLSYSSQDWMVSAFSSVWSELQNQNNDANSTSNLTEQKAFLTCAWIDEQIDYHRKTRVQHHLRNHLLLYGGNVLFGLTLFMAFLHVFHVGSELWNKIFGFMAIVCPAAAAALGAIRTHREYLRNAKRSGEMVRHLEELKIQLQKAQNPEQFYRCVREIEETMLHENEDWRIVVRFHELEPPA
jgi:hypothetical protein